MKATFRLLVVGLESVVLPTRCVSMDWLMDCNLEWNVYLLFLLQQGAYCEKKVDHGDWRYWAEKKDFRYNIVQTP